MAARDLIFAAAGAAPNVAWDLDFAYYDPSKAWDISTAVFRKGFSIVAQDSAPQAVSFRPDGTVMYVLGGTGSNVYQYSLSTAWDVSTATYVKSFAVGTQDNGPTGFFFKPDGTAMYMVGTANDNVNQYSLSTAWDVGTASYVKNFSVSSQETLPQGISFKSDGTAMYVIGASGDDVNQYSLSTAWDVGTASYVKNFSVAAQDTAPTDIFFKPDGTVMYVTGNTGDAIYQYSLSTAWDVGTASYVKNFSVASADLSPVGLFFKSDGTLMYMIGSEIDAVRQYRLGGFSVAAQDTSPQAVFFKPDGTVMYIVGDIGDDVNQYSLSTAWDVGTASYVKTFSVATQDSSPNDIFFKPDGTVMYVIGALNDRVYQYSLSTAWDVGTASYVKQFPVSSQENSPNGLFFKPDGTAMYVIGSTGDDVNQYSLSTAWDIGTASFVQLFSVAAQSTSPQDVFFKSDGKAMYIMDAFTPFNISQYALSTAWDVSTATYVKNFSVDLQDNGPVGLFFKPDGKAMYMVGISADAVYQYSIGIQE